MVYFKTFILTITIKYYSNNYFLIVSQSIKYFSNFVTITPILRNIQTL